MTAIPARFRSAVIGAGILLLVVTGCHSTPQPIDESRPPVLVPTPTATGPAALAVTDTGPREHANGDLIQDVETGQIVGYIVTDGDTIVDIAARFQVDADQLVSEDGVRFSTNSMRIYPGEQIHFG